MRMKNGNASGIDAAECISDDLLFRYVEGATTRAETSRINKHLSSCENCFNLMASLIKNEQSPLNEQELENVKELIKTPIEEQVAKILGYHEQLSQPISEKNTIVNSFSFEALIQSIKSSVDRWNYILKPVAVAVGIVVLMIMGYRGVRYYKTGYQIVKAENLLHDNYKNYIEDARLSGSYEPSGISVLMDAEDANFTYLELAKSRLMDAIDRNFESAKAQQLLAQIFIIEKDYTKADSILTQVKNEFELTASLLNDIGVLYYRKNDWKNAAENFSSAIKVDANFIEAYYNLALAKLKLDESEEARLYLEKYLKLESDGEWNIAAQRLIDQIEKNNL